MSVAVQDGCVWLGGMRREANAGGGRGGGGVDTLCSDGEIENRLLL